MSVIIAPYIVHIANLVYLCYLSPHEINSCSKCVSVSDVRLFCCIPPNISKGNEMVNGETELEHFQQNITDFMFLSKFLAFWFNSGWKLKKLILNSFKFIFTYQ